jgi:DNA-binding NarL/FixJ family response regulator
MLEDTSRGDVEGALERVNIPAYVIDPTGLIRWLNAAGRRLVGDARGCQFTSVVAPEERRHARELFARKIAGTARVTDFEIVLLDTAGDRVRARISSVPLSSGGRVVGVFGQVLHVASEPEPAPDVHTQLTPRQAQMLNLLKAGCSTDQIAAELHLSRETVRNHIRHLLKALGVNSRLAAVAVDRRERVAVG